MHVACVRAGRINACFELAALRTVASCRELLAMGAALTQPLTVTLCK